MNRDDDERFVKWAKKVKKRDDYTCQICGAKNTYLNSHHMNSWNWAINERYNIDNGVTLCVNCHNRFHEIYSVGNNTKEQFNEFREINKSLLELISKKVNDELRVQRIIEFVKQKEDGYEPGR